MRSVIKQSYTFTEEYSIDSVVGLSEKDAIVLATSQSGEYVLIYVLNDKHFIKSLSNIPAMEKYKIAIRNLFVKIMLFKYKSGFGLIIEDYIYIWNSFDSEFKELQITNDFLPDKANRHIHKLRGSEIINTNSLLVLLSDYFISYSARYYSFLKLYESNAKWEGGLIELDVHQYGLEKGLQGWIVIEDAIMNNEILTIFTIGEEKNYYKYGMDLSVMSKTNLNSKMIKGRKVEPGFGNFNTSKDFLIIHSLKKKSKLYFYRLQDDKVHELSLSVTRNLGKGSNEYIRCDLIGNSLWIFNADMLNLCEITLE